MDWSLYPNFRKEEFDCKHTGINRMRPEFMELLQQIRDTYSRPMIISSGYRDKAHPIEAVKQEPGEHFYGVAADIQIYGPHALELIYIAYNYGVKRIGIKQHGPTLGRFIHLGIGDRGYGFPPTTWSYP